MVRSLPRVRPQSCSLGTLTNSALFGHVRDWTTNPRARSRARSARTVLDDLRINCTDGLEAAPRLFGATCMTQPRAFEALGGLVERVTAQRTSVSCEILSYVANNCDAPY